MNVVSAVVGVAFHPRRTARELLAGPHPLRTGLGGFFVLAAMYTFTVGWDWLNGFGAGVEPWVPIPAEDYYFCFDASVGGTGPPSCSWYPSVREAVEARATGIAVDSVGRPRLRAGGGSSDLGLAALAGNAWPRSRARSDFGEGGRVGRLG